MPQRAVTFTSDQVGTGFGVCLLARLLLAQSSLGRPISRDLKNSRIHFGTSCNSKHVCLYNFAHWCTRCFDTSWRALVQSPPSSVTVDDRCTVDIGIFVHKTVKSSLWITELANFSEWDGPPWGTRASKVKKPRERYGRHLTRTPSASSLLRARRAVFFRRDAVLCKLDLRAWRTTSGSHQLSVWMCLIPELHLAGMEPITARRHATTSSVTMTDPEMYDGEIRQLLERLTLRLHCAVALFLLCYLYPAFKKCHFRCLRAMQSQSHRLQFQRSRLALRRRIGFLHELAGRTTRWRSHDLRGSVVMLDLQCHDKIVPTVRHEFSSPTISATKISSNPQVLRDFQKILEWPWPSTHITQHTGHDNLAGYVAYSSALSFTNVLNVVVFADVYHKTRLGVESHQQSNRSPRSAAVRITQAAPTGAGKPPPWLRRRTSPATGLSQASRRPRRPRRACSCGRGATTRSAPTTWRRRRRAAPARKEPSRSRRCSCPPLEDMKNSRVLQPRARLHGLTCNRAVVNRSLVACCHSGERLPSVHFVACFSVVQRSPGVVEQRVDQSRRGQKPKSLETLLKDPAIAVDETRDKLYFKRVYTDVTFAIESEFVRLALDDSAPIADLQAHLAAEIKYQELRNDLEVGAYYWNTNTSGCGMQSRGNAIEVYQELRNDTEVYRHV
ncbi:hypothetical protein PR048_027550 [Dryococelus australis]|uniref:Uncharacterized protein n=1 Tax=Dryococelus australis TaxID=614101 RepID=A0ABQ9GGU7_9NEOP|nr:hypothetical protein PR048_027550 [Dryococelus australis]